MLTCFHRQQQPTKWSLCVFPAKQKKKKDKQTNQQTKNKNSTLFFKCCFVLEVVKVKIKPNVYSNQANNLLCDFYLSLTELYTSYPIVSLELLASIQISPLKTLL